MNILLNFHLSQVTRRVLMCQLLILQSRTARPLQTNVARPQQLTIRKMRSLQNLVAMPASHAASMCSLQLFSFMNGYSLVYSDAFRKSLVQDFWQPVSIGISYKGKAWSVEYVCILYGWCGCCCASFSEQTQQSLFWTKRLRHSTILLLTMGYTIKLGTCPLLVVGGRCLS